MFVRPVALCAFAPVLFILIAVHAQAQSNPGHYKEFGDAGGVVNILPPGQDGVLNSAEAIAAAQGAGILPPHFADQLGMYGDLVYNAPGLTEERILDFFKDASFGVPADDIDRVYSPTDDVVVIRDISFGVPHIFGDTRYATMFAQGYTGAEDRLFLMDVLRHLGRARLSEFLGGSAANQALDRGQLAIAPYLESDLTAQITDGILNAGPDGPAMFADLQAYTDGVNQYIDEAIADSTKMPSEYPALQVVPEPWVIEDAVAIASLVGGIFGKGGGGELTNHCGLKELTTNLGGDAVAARAVFDDFHAADDAEAPTTSPDTFPYLSDLGPVDPAAHPDVDCSSLVPVDPMGPSLEDLQEVIAGDGGLGGLLGSGSMSNALLMSGEHTASGRPIVVFGPQTAYYVPQLLVEKDVHGPDIDARGASFAGVDLWVQLGRGRNYAFSATSASADNVDQWVLRLCEPGGGTPTTASMGYEYNGGCETVEAYDHVQTAKPSAGGPPGVQESGSQCDNAVDDEGDGFVNDGCPPVDVPEILCADATDDDFDGKVNDGCPPVAGPDLVLSWPVERTEHYGPILARGTLEDGTPIAIATLRTTYRDELGSARGFYQINNPNFMTDGVDSFRQAMGAGVDYTFNWFYVDSKDIAYQHSCRCPQRAPGVDPYLPAWGDGTRDWQGFIPFEAQPFAVNPAQGYLSSWNNKQAPGFVANDRNYAYGPVYRSLMLDVRLEALVAAGDVERTDMIDAMEDAGTVDLRGQEVLPLLLDVLGTAAPGGLDPRVQDMRDRLAAWLTTETHRRDFDNDGEYDDPQSPAIMDAWWEDLSRTIFDAESGNVFDALRLPFDDHNRQNHIGSAFQGGSYGHIHKDLRQILGRPVIDPFSKTYCGAGVLADCKQDLWESLERAASDLEAEFSDPDVADWKRSVDYEEVQHSVIGVTAVPAIHWINRPTFQQVVQFGGAGPFKCYKSRTRKGDAKFARQTITLEDELDNKTTLVIKPKLTCNPASVGGAEVADVNAHLSCYQIRDGKGQPKFSKLDVAVGDELGGGLRTLLKARTVCLPSAQDFSPLSASLGAYKCYKAKDAKGAAKFAKTSIDLVDEFEDKAMRVLKPRAVCGWADVDGGGVVDGGAGLACYKVRRERGAPKFARRDVAITNVLENANHTAEKPRQICVPSVNNLP